MDAVAAGTMINGLITGDQASVIHASWVLGYSLPNTLGAGTGYIFMASSKNKKAKEFEEESAIPSAEDPQTGSVIVPKIPVIPIETYPPTTYE